VQDLPYANVTLTLTNGSQTYQLAQGWTAVGAPYAGAAYPAYAATITASGAVEAFASGIPTSTCNTYGYSGTYPLTFTITFPL
jgi:hypothetical protein